ncbi:hypothetical protein Nepgr_009034 [Nepenthes gracilis]|uniref:UspA domain-containing protein n=1 Tax=Nepenthes gracilis TaxID=150966 RepID=A0AAD3SAP3_NEPGR|nr:hypothetical protein Nepgr_009034 [Nepenthes gracilis]
MHSKSKSDTDRPVAIEIQPSSPRYPLTPTSGGGAPTAFGGNRKIAIAVDLSDESAFTVRWAVQNYFRPGDTVTILHVRPTSILYGADWGSTRFSVDIAADKDGEGGSAADLTNEESRKKMEDDFDQFTVSKITDLAQPLVEAKIPFRVHIVKDHDMKERLCLEIERLGLSAVIMGSRGFGESRRSGKGRLGSVSDYCVHHCVCPVVVVRYPEEKDGGSDGGAKAGAGNEAVGSLHPVPEEEQEYHDATEEHKVPT